jgi:hypothetical protein
MGVRPTDARVLTRKAATRRVVIMVGFVAATQFVLSAASYLAPRAAMPWLWFLAAVVVGAGTIAFETHEPKRGG